MIPQIYITEWTRLAPWPSTWQVEQDLIITTALLKIYEHPELRKMLAFRGGTALHKLYIKPASRYSEDIDLVQINPGPIKNTVQLVQRILDPWLGKSEVKQSRINTTLIYKKMTSEDNFPLKLKLEIHTREHFSVLGFQEIELLSNSAYYPSSASITSYKLEELLGTKIRCLSQRRCGRDLFDLYAAIKTFPSLSINDIVHCYSEYTRHEESRISKKQLLNRISEHLKSSDFLNDTKQLISTLSDSYDPVIAHEYLLENLFSKME